VALEPQTFRLLLDADARLAAAAGGVVRYLADVAGFENDAIARLQSAVIAACAQVFEQLTADHPRLEITFTRLSDRIEVALAPRGDGLPVLGLNTAAFVPGGGGTGSPRRAFAGFDRTQYGTQNGEAVTRLTKYIGPGNIDQSPSIT
jgi:hypothetical protein